MEHRLFGVLDVGSTPLQCIPDTRFMCRDKQGDCFSWAPRTTGAWAQLGSADAAALVQSEPGVVLYYKMINTDTRENRRTISERTPKHTLVDYTTRHPIVRVPLFGPKVCDQLSSSSEDLPVRMKNFTRLLV